MHAIEIFYCEEDTGFIANRSGGCRLLSLWQDGCGGALQEVEIAMQLWLQAAKETGRAIPVPLRRASWVDSHTILTVLGEKFR